MRNEKRNYVLVGAFVIAMAAALVVWIGLLTGRTGPMDPYFIVYDNVTGLEPGVEILFEGYRVGFIDEIRPIDQDGRRRYRVAVSVKRGWPIPVDSRAGIATGLFSANVIDIDSGVSDQHLAPGSEIPAEEAADLFAVANELTDVLQNSVKPLLEEVAQGKIIANVETFTAELNRAIGQVNALLDTTNVERVARILARVDEAAGNANELTRELGVTRGRIDSIVRKVDQLFQEEQGQVGQALADLNHSLAAISRHIDAIASDLETTTRNMSEFSRQIRDNPGLLIRGRDAEGELEGAG